MLIPGWGPGLPHFLFRWNGAAIKLSSVAFPMKYIPLRNDAGSMPRPASMHTLLRTLLLLTVMIWSAPSLGLEQVRLQLKWQHQFQFAGYYAALAKGYYREAGLDVDIVPAQPGEDGVQKVLSGQAEFGVGTSELMLLRDQGQPVVVLAVIFQHSPLALISLKKDGIQTVQSLKNGNLMIEPGSAELFAYLRREGLGTDRIKLLPHSSNIDDLIAGRVIGMSVYITDEPFALVQSQREYLLFSPRAAGIDFYGDNLFTTEAQLKAHPERVKAFRQASLRGWDYAMRHPDEIAALIHDHYSSRHSLDHLRFEASQMAPLLQTALIESGHMYLGRWRHIAEIYAELGMLKPDFDLDGFVYDPTPPPPDLTLLYLEIAGLAAGLALVGGIALYILRTNRRLRGSEKRYQVLFDTMPLALIVFDMDCRIVAWNSHACRVFGWSREQAMGHNIYELLVPTRDLEQVQRQVGRMLKERIVTHSTNRNLTRDGQEITCEWFNALYYGENGQVAGGIALGSDISQRVLSEARLAKAKQMAEQLLSDQRHFLSMVSHELRTPLAVVDSTAQVMSVHCESKCGSSEIFRRLRQGLMHFSDCFDNWLAEDKLHRLLEEGLPPTENDINVQDFLEHVLAQARPMFPQYRLLLTLDGEPGRILGDEQLLSVLLHNLIGNACKYSPQGSRIDISTDTSCYGTLGLKVRDPGIGIPPAELAQVRDRYFRGQNRGRTGGMGLGLFLVDRITQLHRGHLDIESQINLGTTISVRLPRNMADPA